MAEYYLQQSDYAAGLVLSQRLATLEPWHEGGQRLQMQLLAANDQRSAVLTQYERLRQQLAEELQAAPQPETTALYEQLRIGDYDRETRR